MHTLRRIVHIFEEGIVRVPIVSRIYWELAPAIHEAWRGRHKTVSEPVFERRWVSPKEITHYSGLEPWYASEGNLLESFGVVRGGDWDCGDLRKVAPYRTIDEVSHVDKIEGLNDLLLPSFSHRFEDGKDWEATPLWRHVTQRVNDGQRIWHGCESIEDVHDRCTTVDALYKSLNTGYKSSKELSETGDVPRRFMKCMRNEVLVDLGRDGELLFADGAHRLLMARILDIDEIPIAIVTTHKNY